MILVLADDDNMISSPQFVVCLYDCFVDDSLLTQLWTVDVNRDDDILCLGFRCTNHSVLCVRYITCYWFVDIFSKPQASIIAQGPRIQMGCCRIVSL